MQSLPPVTQQMGANLQAAAATGNLGAWQQTIRYGYDLIDTLFRPHPIKRPFDLFRRAAARRQWEAQVRVTEAQLRSAMMEAALREFKTKLNRPMDQADWDFTEQQRRSQVIFDIDQQIRLAAETAKINATYNPPPPPPAPPEDPDGVIADHMAKIAAVENDPTLKTDQKRRRIDTLNRALEIRLSNGKR